MDWGFIITVMLLVVVLLETMSVEVSVFLILLVWNLGLAEAARSKSLPPVLSNSNEGWKLGMMSRSLPSLSSNSYAASNLGRPNVNKPSFGSALPSSSLAGCNLGITNVKKSKVGSHLPWTPYAGSNLGTSNVKKSKVGSPLSWTSSAESNLGTSNVKKSKVGSPLSSTLSAASSLYTSNVKKSRVKKSSPSTSFASASNSGVSYPKKARSQSPIASSSSVGCFLKIYDDKQIPLLLNFDGGSYKIAEREDRQVKLRAGDKIVIACADDNNKIILDQMIMATQMVTATCVKYEILKINGGNYVYRDIKCKDSIMGSVATEKDTCSNNRGVKKSIQFEISTGNSKYKIPLIAVCYDEKTTTPLYSRHELIGTVLELDKVDNKGQFSGTDTNRDGKFSAKRTVGTDRNIHSVVYNRHHQTYIVEKILSSKDLAEKFLKLSNPKVTETAFARGHLAPDADFYDHPTKSATYYYINTVPQSSSNNNANWKSIETQVRKLAKKCECTLDIITGIHGVLSLNDTNDNPQDIFLLEGDKCPVPKYIWKVVYDKVEKRGIAIVSIHDLSITDATPHVFCTNICNQSGWKGKNWSEVKKGYVFCCDLNQFRREIADMDLDNLQGDKVLQGPDAENKKQDLKPQKRGQNTLRGR